jgi:hypothetical protein
LSRLSLTASSDDYLLEESLDEAVARACAELDGVEAERLAEDATPEAVAVELRSPSLFASCRVLVLGDVRSWLDAPAPRGSAPAGEPVDLQPLLDVLADGIPEGMALVMGAWCGRRPKGELVEAVAEADGFRWIALPEAPKPWEEVVLSRDQREVLGRLMAKVTGTVRFEAAAARLLMDRLGFEPRALVQEASKLSAAAGEGGVVDEELVRQLVFPRERSLEVVRDAVLNRDLGAMLDLIMAADAGVPVHDWQGRRLDVDALGIMVCGQVSNLLQQLAYLRLVVAELGFADELDAKRSEGGRWYQERFGKRLAPALMDRLKEEGASPLVKKGKPPTKWTLGQLFRGAARFEDDELLRGLAESGDVEAELRGALPLEALTAWLTRLLTRRSA